ncbi:Uncharacterised protein [Mycobacteroides abscessus subsp. abscessus]|nr:Uncharacterised protein [Mycobacteroides abscessus subsp. abscessus]
MTAPRITHPDRKHTVDHHGQLRPILCSRSTLSTYQPASRAAITGSTGMVGGFHSSRDQADGGSAGMLVNPREKSSFIDCIMRIFE